MGQLKNLLVTVAVAVLLHSANAQRVLQFEQHDDHSFLHKRSDSKDKPIISLQQATKLEQGTFDDQSLEWRLKREVIPTEYWVKITPVIDAGEAIAEQWFVPGQVNITVQAQRATRNIILHSKNITIHEVKVTQGSSAITVEGFTHGNHDFLNISLGSTLQQGQTYVVQINFTSYITEDLNGLYRSSYINPDTNNTTWLATTQMEALHARQMMPCFDEPALKSIFHFTIGRKEKYLVLFNTELVSSEPGPTGWIYDVFAPTVKMSTYLLALIVSEFKYAEAPGNVLPGKRVRTYAPDHYIREQGGVYAAENAEKVLAFFGSYFDKQYPLSKMDSAAVPDFYFGAMENYGLNIYRETALLVFPNVTLESERWSITSVIGHELAHQWFGNLVSPAWWTHIWLNEGFATYFASIVSDHTNLEFEPRKRFLNDAVQRSMEFAADPNYAHSVKIGEVEWATKWAMDWFDRMAYEQAGSLIRMMDGFLSTPVLTAGLKTYLNRLQFGAAQQDDLFRDLNILAEATNKIPNNLTIKEIMDTWTLKPGFPLVRVSRASANRIYVSQEKFTTNLGSADDVSVDDELWHIPISIATRSTPNFDGGAEQWLDKNVAMTSWEINADEWIILNVGATGYYRVLYDTPLTNLIKALLESNNYHVIDSFTRSQLLDDYFTSAYQRYINLATALDLTLYLGNDVEIIVWNTVLKHLRKPLNLFGNGDRASIYDAFRSYLLPRIKSAVNATGGLGARFPERTGMPVLRHQQFMDWACALEDEECQNISVNYVTQWKNTGNNEIPRDIQQIVYCSAVAKGSEEIFKFIKERYNDSSTSTTQRSRLLNALGCATDLGSINELLEGTLTQGYFQSSSHASTILQRLAMTPVARQAVIRFIRENAAEIKNRLGSASPIASVYTSVASYVSTQVELQTLEAIADEIAETIEGVRQTVNAALNTIRSNIAWMSEFGESFESFLAKPT